VSAADGSTYPRCVAQPSESRPTGAPAPAGSAAAQPARPGTHAAQPARPGTHATYRERLRAPWWLWIAAPGLTALFSAELFLGAGPWVWVPYVVLVPASLLGLWLLGRVRVAVVDGELSVGGARLPVHRITGVTVLGPAQRTLLLGPAAHRHARIVQRPWVPGALQIHLDDLDGSTDRVPYWMVSSRRPAALAAAILAARAEPTRGGGAGTGAAGVSAADTGSDTGSGLDVDDRRPPGEVPPDR